MRTYRILLSFSTLLVAIVVAYTAFIFVYTDHMFTPPALLAAPSSEAPASPWQAPLTPFIHKVNTPQRAQQKDEAYNGFEVDIWVEGEQLLAAHDQQETLRKITLSDIFAAVKNPGTKSWWLDLKRPLTPQMLQHILQLAQQYHIPAENLLFEVEPGPTAQLIKKENLGLLLPLPEGFEQDQADPKIRARLNKQALDLWQEYRPAAVSASFGKYTYLRAYFPQMPKAIYYSSTQRPSLKKSFMRKHMQSDPSVKIFMTDEYTWINF